MDHSQCPAVIKRSERRSHETNCSYRPQRCAHVKVLKSTYITCPYEKLIFTICLQNEFQLTIFSSVDVLSKAQPMKSKNTQRSVHMNS